MVYTTNQIIEKARAISDIDNSSYVSYKENISLLNDAFTDVYNRIIQVGDNSFVKNMEGIGVLPEDFYQLHSVKYQSGALVPRYSKGDYKNTPSYEIIGNEIIIHGNNNQGVEIKYYTQPPVLTFKPDDITIENLLYSDANNDLTVLFGGQSFETSKITSNTITKDVVATSVTITDAKVNNGYVYILSNANDLLIYKDGILLETFSGYTAMWHGNASYSLTLTTTAGTYSIVNGTNITAITIPIEVTAPFYEYENGFIYYKNAEYVFYSNETGTETTGVLDSTLENICISGYYIYGNIKRNIVLYQDIEVLENYIIISKDKMLKFLMLISADTGYGILADDLKESETVVTSAYPDTVLDFPNPIFFSLISYSMANSYRIKQGSDNLQIGQKINEMYGIFNASVDSDKNRPYVISNVY